MIAVEPGDLTYEYRLRYRGVPSPLQEFKNHPLRWEVNVALTPDRGTPTPTVASATAYLVPDAGLIDLAAALELAAENLDEIQVVLSAQPDLMRDLGMYADGGDLMVVTALTVERDYRGQALGHHVVNALLETVGRAVRLTVLKATLGLGAEETLGAREDTDPVDSQRTYWENFGFMLVEDDVMAYSDWSTWLVDDDEDGEDTDVDDQWPEPQADD
jgi:GNAT superfamily N-acetyltransferase